MIYLRTYKINNAKSTANGKYFLRSFSMDTYDLEKLAEHMSQHNTPYSVGAIRGVLKDMATCIKELLMEGKKVKIDNICIFGVGAKTNGTDTEEAFTADNVARFHINCQGTGVLATRESKLMNQANFKIMDWRADSATSQDGTETGN